MGNVRPSLNKDLSKKDFLAFYWLKEELLLFCKGEQLQTNGSKATLNKRIIHYLDTGKRDFKVKKIPPTSTFDWKKEALTQATIICDNYKNSENVRQFFKKEIGDHFKFNVLFMNWMKQNQGKTLAEAIVAWHQIKTIPKEKKQIAPQFEYNQYIRDFLADNPDLKLAIAIQSWKIKRSKRGDNIYRKEDLESIL